jgi:hypothetical protein
MQRWELAFRSMLLDLDRSLSPEQRRRAVSRMHAFAADFRQLAVERQQTAAAAALAQ